MHFLQITLPIPMKKSKDFGVKNKTYIKISQTSTTFPSTLTTCITEINSTFVC